MDERGCVPLGSPMGRQDDFLVTVPLAGPGWAAGGFFVKEIAPLPDVGGLDHRYGTYSTSLP